MRIDYKNCSFKGDLKLNNMFLKYLWSSEHLLKHWGSAKVMTTSLHRSAED